MTNLRRVLFLSFLFLTFTSLACPTRTIPIDGGSSGTDGSAGTTGDTGGAGGGPGGVGGGALGGTPGGLGGAGGGGIVGSGGAGGTTNCTNTITDALNCGSCGHSCLGGQCTASVCQPLLLGTVPSTSEYAHKTVVSGGSVHVFTGDGPSQPNSIWQVDAITPGTPTEVVTNGIVSCVMNGQLFWITDDQGTYGIASCKLSNCAATTVPIVTLSSGNYFGMAPGCDVLNDEIVWTSTSDNATFSINRASPTGSNKRTLTSFFFADSNWHLVGDGSFPGEIDRIFYRHTDLTSGTDWLYYISTNVLNAAAVQIAEIENIALPPGIAPPSELTNDAAFLASEYSASTAAFATLRIPLPNGILSGAPPVFIAGYIYAGVVDQTSFYGTVEASSVPADAIIKCPISDCSAPTIVARGQANASNFADDGTAIYWTTNGQASNAAIWKVAK